MKLEKYIIVCIFFVLLFACINNTKNNNISSNDQKIDKDLIDEIIENKNVNLKIEDLKDVHFLTKDEINELEKESKIGNMIIFKIGMTMSIASDGELTYYLLGYNLSDYSIQYRFKQIFSLNHQEIKDDDFSESKKISKFVFNQSFLKICNQTDIVSGRIKDKEVFMPLNIYIGISKKNFFEKIFNNSNQYDFSIVDTFSNGNEIGDIIQDFIFKNDTLKEVVIKSDYDWISFDLY